MQNRRLLANKSKKKEKRRVTMTKRKRASGRSLRMSRASLKSLVLI